MTNVLLVAFDGMDKELIEDYGCENLLGMHEFGSIDNSSNTFSIWTTELFVSLLTGVNYEEHGVRMLARWDNERLDRLEKALERFSFFQKFNGLRKRFWEFLGFERKGYTRDDYPQDTLFDKIGDSRGIDVPGYDVLIDKGGSKISSHGIQGAVSIQDWVHEKKKEDLMEAIEHEHDFLMAHFHKVDHFHHWFWEVGEKEQVREVYHEFDRLAGEILEKAEPRYDYIIFISDHGLPTSSGHNENAFYSCNRVLFPDGVPRITDFHDRILEIVGGESGAAGNERGGRELTEEQEQKVKQNLEDMGYI